MENNAAREIWMSSVAVAVRSEALRRSPLSMAISPNMSPVASSSMMWSSPSPSLTGQHISGAARDHVEIVAGVAGTEDGLSRGERNDLRAACQRGQAGCVERAEQCGRLEAPDDLGGAQQLAADGQAVQHHHQALLAPRVALGEEGRDHVPEVVRVDPDQRDESVAFAVAGVGLDEEARRGLVALAPVVALDLGVARDPVHLSRQRVVGGHALEAERVRQLVHEGEHGRRRRMPGARPDHVEVLGKQAIARRVHQRAEVVDAPPGVAQQVRHAELEAEARVGIATPVSAQRTGLGTKDGARLAGQFTLEDVQREVADDLACVVAVHVDPGVLGRGLDHVLRERVAADAVKHLAMDLVERIDELLPRGGVELVRDDDGGSGDLRHGCPVRMPAGCTRGGGDERFCPTARTARTAR